MKKARKCVPTPLRLHDPLQISLNLAHRYKGRRILKKKIEIMFIRYRPWPRENNRAKSKSRWGIRSWGAKASKNHPGDARLRKNGGWRIVPDNEFTLSTEIINTMIPRDLHFSNLCYFITHDPLMHIEWFN